MSTRGDSCHDILSLLTIVLGHEASRMVISPSITWCAILPGIRNQEFAVRVITQRISIHSVKSIKYKMLGPFDRRTQRSRCEACARRQIKASSSHCFWYAPFLPFIVWRRVTMLVLYQKETEMLGTGTWHKDWPRLCQPQRSFERIQQLLSHR